VVRDDQPDARGRGQGRSPWGVGEVHVPMKPVIMPGGGTVTSVQDERNNVVRGPGDCGNLTKLLESVQKTAEGVCTRKRRQKPAIVSTPCTTRSAARDILAQLRPVSLQQGRTGCGMDRTSRISRCMGCSDGLANWRLRSGRDVPTGTPSEECHTESQWQTQAVGHLDPA